MRRAIVLVVLFAIAFAFVESAVVVYLRSLYYPEGFRFPLKLIADHHLIVELAREVATIVMLASVGLLAGTTRWSRFAFFAIAFGVWDIFYYLWLKLILDWPATLLDWDILFLIPIPWIGPVIAPVLVSAALIVGGVIILRREASGEEFRAPRVAWALAVIGTLFLLASFMWDVEAGLKGTFPRPYRYEMLVVGLACYGAAMVAAFRRRRTP